MNTFITADTHFGHSRILNVAARSQFSTIEEHDDHLLDRINTLIGRRDRLIIAGDFGLEKCRQWIVCKDVVLIRGNHDRKNPKAFTRVLDSLAVKHNGFKIWVSHYPHAFWPDSHNGSGHVYGHLHSNREKWLDAVMPGRQSMDVGMDNAKRLTGDYRPFSLSEIHDILTSRMGHDRLEFYRQLDEQRLTAKSLDLPVV